MPISKRWRTISDIISKTVPGIRMLFDMKNVIYDRDWLSSAKNIELYYMYREMSMGKKDALAYKRTWAQVPISLSSHHRMLGCEFVKTAGHYHPLSLERKSHFLRYMKYWAVKQYIYFKNRQEKA